MVATPKYELIQDRLGQPLDETLREFHTTGVSAPAIARILASRTRVVVTPETIRTWIRLVATAAR